MIYSMERAVEMMDESKGVEKMVWLVDCKGYNLQYNGEVKVRHNLDSSLTLLPTLDITVKTTRSYDFVLYPSTYI